MSELPSTETIDVDILIKTNSERTDEGRDPPYLEAYTHQGTFAVANVVNRYIFAINTVTQITHPLCWDSWLATKSCRIKGYCDNDESVQFKLYGTVNFPNPEVVSSAFWGYGCTEILNYEFISATFFHILVSVCT